MSRTGKIMRYYIYIDIPDSVIIPDYRRAKKVQIEISKIILSAMKSGICKINVAGSETRDKADIISKEKNGWHNFAKVSFDTKHSRFDFKRPEQEILKEYAEAVEKAGVFSVLLSNTSKDSDYNTFQIFARDFVHVPVIPFPR